MAAGQTRINAEREATVALLDIRVLTAVEEFEACVQMQKTVWGFADLDVVPRRMFVVARKIGGLVLGAWDGARLAGFTMALPGHRPGQTYWHSHMLAVGADYRERGLGRALKMRQRQEALAQGIELIEWTFDPLEVKNAYFNLERLGAIVRHYHADLYGSTTSQLQGGLPSDRLTAEWWLRAPRVAALAEAGTAETLPWEVKVEVPAARSPEAQARIRREMTEGFGHGLAAVGYERLAQGGAFYLGPGEPA